MRSAATTCSRHNTSLGLWVLAFARTTPEPVGEQSTCRDMDCFVASLLAMTPEGYGLKIDAPVVARLSRSICARAASLSA
jgi:hypothetical protein